MISRLLLYALCIAASACGSSQGREQQPVAAEVKVGAEVLISSHLDELAGKRIGLVMNPTARIKGTHMLDTLLALGVNITALYAPEHGFRGEAGAGETIKNGKDQATGLPVYSLYGKTKKPTPQMLQRVDLLLFDMQDVGARFYTYNATLGRVLEAAAQQKIPVWVLDRPNPAGGDYVSGWVLDPKYKSFVGLYPIPMVHGMTLGELAKMMVGEGWLHTKAKPQLKVIPMQGWKRSMKWPDTGLPWIAPSPNLPSFEHAYMYLGTVLFEGTNISEGRGTNDPFLTIGSPQTQLSAQLVAAFNQRYPSVSVTPASFRPRSMPGKALHPKFEGEECHGVKLAIHNYKNFKPVAFGVELLKLMITHTKNGALTNYIYKLAGSKQIDAYSTDWDDEVEAFKKARRPYLIYD